MQSILYKYDMPGMVLDSSNMSENEVVEEMVKTLIQKGLIND